MATQSLLQKARLHYHPKLPSCLSPLTDAAVSSTAINKMQTGNKMQQSSSEVAALFPETHAVPRLTIVKGAQKAHPPLRVGVVLSGGQAPGGHNVITGLFDGLKALNPQSILIGFADGPSGIVDNQHSELKESLIADYRNQGGFDLIGSGRTKIETAAQFNAAEETMRKLNLDGLVVVGGDDSNTNAAWLAEDFATKGIKTTVVGVPKTIDGDLKNDDIEISFGFDTASKVYADTIGNLMRDALSAKKYYYFIKLMGRSASHITLECALQTHPNMALISEEVAAERKTLKEIVSGISDMICVRAAQGKDYGIILIPEGVIEFIPEVKALIEELNALLSKEKPHDAAIESLGSQEEKIAYASKWLSSNSLSCFQNLPKDIQAQLLIGRDSHGNVQVSKIETERMLMDMVKKELKTRAKAGNYKGKFSPQPHFCGYEGRSCLPSNFDSQYCYALGQVAALLIDAKASGYICCVKNLAKPVEEWEAGGIPLTSMMVIEQRHGEPKPVIEKALVDLKGRPFQRFEAARTQWMANDDYVYPGPVQFFGPAEIADAITLTLALESE